MLNMNSLRALTIVIPQLLCQFSLANAILSTVEFLNSDISDLLNPFNSAHCAFASMRFAIELVSLLLDGKDLDNK